MTADAARGTRWSDLVNGLLDARSDPATARFEEELESAVAAGELSRRTAQRLRYWQRTAVNAVDDHARTVLPAVLGALDAARSEAEAYVEQRRATLDAADDGGTTDDDFRRRTTAAEQAETVPAEPSRTDEGVRRASTAASHGPSTLEGPAPRLFLADLREVPAATDTT